MSCPQSVTVPLVGLFQAGESIDQLRLSISVDAGHANDLTGTYIKAHAIHGVALVVSTGRDRQVPPRGAPSPWAGPEP